MILHPLSHEADFHAKGAGTPCFFWGSILFGLVGILLRGILLRKAA